MKITEAAAIARSAEQATQEDSRWHRWGELSSAVAALGASKKRENLELGKRLEEKMLEHVAGCGTKWHKR